MKQKKTCNIFSSKQNCELFFKLIINYKIDMLNIILNVMVFECDVCRFHTNILLAGVTATFSST